MDEDDDAAAAVAAAERQRALNMQYGQNAGNVIGQQVQYEDVGEIQDSVIRARRYQICLQTCIAVPILLIIILVVDYYRRNGHSCGIPVQWWIEIWFIILLVYYLLALNELWIIRCNRGCVIPWVLTLAAIVILALCIMVIYGYVIYFSDDNNCQDYTDTSVFLVFMIIFLFFGLFLLLLLCLLLICGPILYCQYRDAMKQPGKLENEGQINAVINNLQKVGFDPKTMTAETTCTICYEEFKPGDQVTQLKCNEAHIFHTDCIVGWIQRGENTCPLCRADIDNVEQLREMMQEGGELENLLAEYREHNNNSRSDNNRSKASIKSAKSNKSKRSNKSSKRQKKE